MQRRRLEMLLGSVDEAVLAGNVQRIAGNQPILLTDPDQSLLVLDGHVDVFAVLPAGDGAGGQRHSLFRAAAGELVFGPVSSARHKFLVVGAENTQVLFDREGAVPARLAPDHLAAMLDRYTFGLMKCVARHRPKDEAVVLDAGSRVEIFRNVPAFGAGRRPTWVRAVDGGGMRFLGKPADAAPSPVLPVSSTAWLEVPDTTKVETLTSKELVASGEWRRAFIDFLAVFDACLADTLAELETATAERQAARQSDEVNVLSASIEEMARTVGPHGRNRSGYASGGDPLHAAFLLVAQELGTDSAAKPKRVVQQDDRSSIDTLAQTYRLRTRKVMLRDRWWQRNAGPLLAYLEDGEDPVALIPAGNGKYDLVDPRDGARRRCTGDVAATLKPEAVMLYRPLPQGLNSLRGLIDFIVPDVRRDLRSVAMTGLAGGLLAAFTPIMTAVIIEQVLPRADAVQHIHIILGLIAAAFGMASFEVVKAFALLRVEGRADLHLQSSLFDRLLRLPAGFFRRFTAGDLSDRTLGIQVIRQTLSGTTIQSLLGVTFACFSLGVLVYYNWRLSLVALLLVLGAIAATYVLGRLQLREERLRIAHQGIAEGFVLQLIAGLAKLRISAAEGRAYAKWAGYFTQQKQRFVRAQSFANWQEVFHNTYPVLATAVIFAAASLLLEMEATDIQLEGMVEANPDDIRQAMSTGEFVAFNTAFGQFLAAMTGLATALTKSLAVVPLFERLQPIVQAEPEVADRNKIAETLRGGIELSHVSFRYDPAGELVLDDLSITIEENEFVAVVGPSGSGKSTLIRLLLGFETCEGGDIYFDQTPIGALDLASLRQQVQVVMQHGHLATGSIFSNIAGGAALTQDDAWAAARQAGLADDIEAMPMGMHTMLMEGVNTLSGGQRQRLMVARALARRPRVLLLDEPTSALDNKTQATVMASISHLGATRVVIAHRLSTVRAADRIIVLDQGRVVEQGTFEELMAAEGAFADMARRQLT